MSATLISFADSYVAILENWRDTCFRRKTENRVQMIHSVAMLVFTALSGLTIVVPVAMLIIRQLFRCPPNKEVFKTIGDDRL